MSDSEVSPIDNQVAKLEGDLEREIDQRKEERFIWFVSVMLIFDVFTFQGMETWTGPLVIGIIQLIFIIVLGRRWQVDHIWILTEKILEKWDGRLK